MNRSILLSCAAGLSALTLAAQSSVDPASARTDLTAGRVPVHTRADEPGQPPYGTWAAGNGYKAGFDGGVTFVPALGRDYPHNQPWTWRTASVRVGATELLAPGHAPRRHDCDFRVEFEHGAVVEAYDVLEQGLEQTFRIGRRPVAVGDLTIVGEVRSLLSCEPTPPVHGSLTFRDHSGAAIVGYGAATAIDADGTVFPMTTSFDGSRITLRLGADDVAAADFPLLVDPLLSRVALVGGDLTAGDVAIEDESWSNNTLLTYTSHYSATDYDVAARICNSNFAQQQTVFSDLSVATSADHPRVAFVAGADRWVIVYQSYNASTQIMQLRARVHGRGATTFGSGSIGKLNATGDHDWRPVVGGTYAESTGNHALIVFQRESGTTAFADMSTSMAMGMRFDASTTSGTWGVPFTLYASPNHDAERPTVNRSEAGGAASSWLTVCQIYNNAIANDDWDLIGRKVNASGVVASGQWLSSLDNTHKMAPVVDGRDGRYCVAYSVAPTSFGKLSDGLGRQVYCERIHWIHGASNPQGNPYAPDYVISSAGRLFHGTGIAYDGETQSHWTLSVHMNGPGGGSLRAYRLGFRGYQIGAEQMLYQVSGDDAGRAAVAHSDTQNETVFLYAAYHSPSDTLYGQERTSDWITPPSHSGTGCSSFQIGWHGPAIHNWEENQRIGSELSGPSVYGSNPNALHLMLVATSTMSVPILDPIVDPGCTLLVPASGPGYLGMMPPSASFSVAWYLRLPETLDPMTVHFQDWVLDAATMTLSATDRLSVPLAR